MNKTRLLIVGLATLGVASLLSAGIASPVREVVPLEKVVALDAVVDHLPVFDVAVCDFDAVKMTAAIEREAVSYVVSESSTAGRSAVTYAKVSAHGRTCGGACNCSLRSTPSTDYEQRM